MYAEKLTELPVPSSGCGDSRVLTDGVELLLEYEYRADKTDWIGGIRFTEIVAYRFRNELHSRGYCSESYEAVAEIKDSLWLSELLRDEPPGIRSARGKRHFAVFLDSNGYLEIIAEAFELLPSRKGLLN